jgi:hypothetical protein
MLVGLLDGAMHVQAVLYRTTRTKILCMEGNHWNQGEIRQIVYKYRASPTVRSIDFITSMHHSKSSIPQVDNARLESKGVTSHTVTRRVAFDWLDNEPSVPLQSAMALFTSGDPYLANKGPLPK